MEESQLNNQNSMKPNYILVTLFLCITTGLFAQKRLVILHTNDTHSRIEPLPATDKSYPNTAGVINRKAVIDSIRAVEENVLLLDAGDFVQGTPYFNLFKGRTEADAMNLIGYEATTIGNHEFDYGLDTMKMIFERLRFPVINSNYDFSATDLKGIVKPYVIIKKYGLRIGLIGLGPNPEGLIQQDKYKGMIFNPIIPSANKYAEILKKKEKCDIIICLSHIGYSDNHANEDAETAVVDPDLAEQSYYIDVIISGHSHTYMKQPDIRKNKLGKDVMIFQVGKNGSYIGKLDIELNKIK